MEQSSSFPVAVCGTGPLTRGLCADWLVSVITELQGVQLVSRVGELVSVGNPCTHLESDVFKERNTAFPLLPDQDENGISRQPSSCTLRYVPYRDEDTSRGHTDIRVHCSANYNSEKTEKLLAVSRKVAIEITV